MATLAISKTTPGRPRLLLLVLSLTTVKLKLLRRIYIKSTDDSVAIACPANNIKGKIILLYHVRSPFMSERAKKKKNLPCTFFLILEEKYALYLDFVEPGKFWLEWCFVLIKYFPVYFSAYYLWECWLNFCCLRETTSTFLFFLYIVQYSGQINNNIDDSTFLRLKINVHTM